MIDMNKVVDNYGEMLGVDPRIIRTDEAADALKQAAADAVQQQAQSEQIAQAAKAAKDASQAPVTGDSVLNRLMTGAGQPGAITAPPTG